MSTNQIGDTESGGEPLTEFVIETEGLTKRYGRRAPAAVADLNLRVRRGEVYGFLGPNGAGKTTTLRMLVGLVRPSAGTVRILGRSPTEPGVLARVGALVEEASFYPFLSGRDNLVVMARHAGVPLGRIEDVLEQVGLLERAGTRFRACSTGMKQRLGVAAALLKDPDVLILDEPANGLDPAGIVEMRALVRRFAGHRTVLFCSHIMSEVEQICDRIGVIDKGRLVAEGTLDELRGHQQLRLRAQPVARARELVTALPYVGGIQLDDGVLLVDTDPAHSGDITRELVTGGVEVVELAAVRPSFERVFLDLIDSNSTQGSD